MNEIHLRAGHRLGGSAGEFRSGASKMLPVSDEMLLALGLYVGAGSEFSISIYDDWNEGPEGEALRLSTISSVDSEGYIEFSLNSPLALHAGDAIYVVVDFGNGLLQPIYIDSNVAHARGIWQSLRIFVVLVLAAVTGSILPRMAGATGILPMKALTAIPEPEDCG